MKRDLDLVRKILFAMEKDETQTKFGEGEPEIDGYEREDIVYHMRIMAQAGLLHVYKSELPHLNDAHLQWRMPKTYVSSYSISWNGYEFLDAARDNTRWEKAKGAMAKAGEFVLPVLMQLLTQYLKAELKLP